MKRHSHYVCLGAAVSGRTFQPVSPAVALQAHHLARAAASKPDSNILKQIGYRWVAKHPQKSPGLRGN